MKGSILNTINAVPPPPPSTSPSTPKKNSKKTLIAVVLLVVLVVAVVAGVYLATRGNGTTNSSTTPTPTPSSNPSVTSNPSTSVIGTDQNIAGASSLQFTVSVTNSSGQSQGSYTYYAKNAGTTSQMIRIEWIDPSGANFVYIVNGALQQVWVESEGQWTDLSSAFASQSSSWNDAFVGYKDDLAGWSGIGDWSYTDPTGNTVRITNVSVNPSLPDSLFTHS